jgi:hypothetical protein
MSRLFIAALLAFATAAGASFLSSPAAAGEDVLSSSRFQGLNGHATEGSVVIKKTDGGAVAVLEEDFSFDGAPDPKLGFGKDGSYDRASTITHLNQLNGHQVIKIPSGVDISGYNEFYVWCERSKAPLGVAKLK